MSEPRAVYMTNRGDADAPSQEGDDVDRAALLDYLMERRRALITELRKIEEMLRLPQSIPARRRPH